jgi:GNAT superfamily N-acetyltransferase
VDAHVIRLATAADVPALSALRTAVAVDLTTRYGQGHWSSPVSERSAELALRHSAVVVLFDGPALVGTLRLGAKKPWAIDRTYFTTVQRAIYLTDMAVDPARQQQGIGRTLIDEAIAIVRAWPAQAIRLDAYDAPAGAGEFYAKCGFAERGRVIYRKVPLVYYERLVTSPASAESAGPSSGPTRSF